MSRSIVNALLPEGDFWTPEELDDYDLLLDAIGENSNTVKIELNKSRHFRNPALTVLLEELENDYGVTPPSGATESERRAALASFMFSRSTTGAADALEAKLQLAGFDVSVHVNSPAVDPALFLNFFSAPQGQLIVNNPDLVQEYILPIDPGYWSQIFFVGGEANRDINGYLTNIDPANIDPTRKRTLKDIILKHKPLFVWCAYVDVYTKYLDGLPTYLDGTWYLDGFGREV